MASLLSWLGGATKRVANTVNNDVLKPINRDIVTPVAHVAAPVLNNTLNPMAPLPTALRNFVVNNAVGLAKQAGGFAGDIVKADIGQMTSNPVAVRNANNAAGQKVAGFAQFIPRAGVQLAATLATAGRGLPQDQQAYQADNPLTKLLLGNEPVPALQQVYRETPGGTVNKLVNTLGTGALDVAGVLGGVKSVEKGAGKVTNALKSDPLIANERGGMQIQPRENNGQYSNKAKLPVSQLEAESASLHARDLLKSIKNDEAAGLTANPSKLQAYNEALKIAQQKRMSPLGLINNERGGIQLGKEKPLPVEPLSKQNPADSLPNTATKDYLSQLEEAQKDAQGKSSKLSSAKAEFATKGIDALSPIEKPVEQAAGGRGGALSLRNQLDRSLRSDTIAGQYAKDNGLHGVINGVKDTKAFDQYVIAKHAADLEANGIKTGRDLGMDAKLVQDLAPKYEAQAKALATYNNKLLDKTVNYGLVSKDTAAYLKQKYPNYVPFDRIFTDAELKAQQGNGAGPASLSTQTVVQRIKGSERQIQSPLESILAKTHDVVAQGERNLAAREIANTVKLPGNPLGLKEIKPNETIGNRSTISYIENGVKRTFETTPEVAQAAKSLNKTQLGLMGKILSYPTRVLRLGATGVNLPFAAANVVKDTASAFINSDHPLQASVANPKVFLQALSASFRHKGAAYGELVREGAGGTSFDIARNSAKDTIGKIRSERNVGTKVAYTVTHPGELLRAVEDTIGRSEEFGRAMQYYGNKEAALKAGKSSGEAAAYGADAARNNTVNFARAGEYGRVLNSTLPYFNAGIQGSRTLLRNLRDKPLQTGAKIAVSASLPVAVTTAWNINDPKRKAAYDDIQDYEKEGNIIIVPPNPKKDASGKWNVIKIPVSQEIANLNNVIRNGVEAMQKDKGFNFAAMAGNLFGTTTSLNAQSPRQLANQVIPQGIKPAIEGLTNQNLFTGNQIVPDKLKGLDAKDQIGKNTSGTAKVLGGATNTSPLQIDNLLRTTLGGAGQTAINAADAGLSKLGVIKPDEVKGKSLQEGITGRFLGAQGQSIYAPIDKAIKTTSDQLKATEGYKKLSADEKAKALNRLENDVVTATKQKVDAANNTGQYAPDFQGKGTTLSTRQAGLLDGSTDVSSYLTTKTSGVTSVSQKTIDDFQKSNKSSQLVGDTVLRKGTDGKVTSTSKVKYDNSLNAATLAQQKSNGDVEGYLNTANKQLQNIQTQLSDPSIDPLEALTLQNQAQALQKNMQKYKGYGGFAKPKVKKLSSATFKTASIKAPKLPSIKLTKTSYKPIKTRKISVSKIPTSATKRKLA